MFHSHSAYLREASPVARSTNQGNARASRCRTGNEYRLSRFLFAEAAEGSPGSPEIMHIGHRIREVLDGKPKGCTVTWFARQLNCDRRNAYNIFNRRNIDIELLDRISRILEHDFYAELSVEFISNLASGESVK